MKIKTKYLLCEQTKMTSHEGSITKKTCKRIGSRARRQMDRIEERAIDIEPRELIHPHRSIVIDSVERSFIQPVCEIIRRRAA